MPFIKAIETAYHGYRFRSRLEARWALCLDSLGVRYQYEPQGYDLGEGGRYLPDFWLTEIEAFLEIKPEPPSSKETTKAEALAVATGRPVFMFCGEIPFPYPGYYEQEFEGIAFLGHNQDFPYYLCVCETCDKVGIAYEGRGDRICKHGKGDRGISHDHPRLMHAYKLARAARFEFGETPKPPFLNGGRF